MSRIGKLPIEITEGVQVQINNNKISVKGSKGELEHVIHPIIKVEIKDKQIIVTRPNDEPSSRALHGTTRAVIQNMVTGVSKGFEKKMEIIGVGYRAQMKGKDIELSLGFSHPVLMSPIEGVVIDVDTSDKNKNIVSVTGSDRQKVGQMAALIRRHRPPEPYKGKGVRYVGEYVPRKAGKTATK